MAAPESPKTSERLTWFILAALSWKFAIAGESRGAGSESLLALSVTVAGAAVGLVAVLAALTDRAGTWLRSPRILAFFGFLVVAFVTVDIVARSRSVYHFTTDADVFTDYGARLLLGGKNPYERSLYTAMVAHRVPDELQTPLADGGFSDRLAYPSLSFVLLLPVVALGIPTTIFYGLALCAALALLFYRAPTELRPLVLLPFFADTTYLAYSFGGLTDSTWALLLCLAVVAWRRPTLAAFFVGLACSYKQHAWLLVPFLLVRIAKEAPTGTRERLRAVARFVLVIGAVFVVTQLPFVLWNPRAWVSGVFEPLVADMVPLGQGLSAFVAQAGIPVPKAAFSLAFWSLYFGLLVVTASWSAGYALAWIAPSLAFILNYRSFTSYWCFNLLPLALELCINQLPASTFTWPYRIRGRTVATLVALAVSAAIALLIARNVVASRDLVVELTTPIRTWGNNVQRVDLRITNKSDHDVEPRFWMQGVSFQPLPWRLDSGPRFLTPGASSTYSVSAIQNVSEFELSRGGNFTVTDRRSSARTTTRIAKDPAALSPREIPNASFAFWDVSIAAPTFWRMTAERSPGANLSPAAEMPHGAIRLALDGDGAAAARKTFVFCPALPSCYAMAGAIGRFTTGDLAPGDEHRVALVADIAARPEPISIWANTPPAANRAPEWAERYGVQLVYGRAAVFVFLGGETAASGTLPDGTPYEVLPGPRDQWTRYTLDLGMFQKRYAKDTYPQARIPLQRFPLLDIPVVPLRVELTYTSRGDEAKSAVFGEIEDPLRGHDPPTDVLRELQEHPGQVDAWRASYEADLGNFKRAREHIARARALESHPRIELQAAHLALMAGDLEDARVSFERSLDVDPIQAHVGLGWTLFVQRKLGEARGQFEAALRAVDEAAKKKSLGGEDEVHILVATVGIAAVEAAQGDCAGAHRTLASVPQRERELREQDIAELAACRRSP